MHDVVIRNGTIVDGTGARSVTGDIALDGERIAAVGLVEENGRREIDAEGLLVTPGWVDIHTHYDGQATWDPEMSPSSWHGVTTVVMGNCGVGFAPVRPAETDFLIELMESVEDIPGTALHEGIDWQWESFPQYLDALAATPRVMDVAAQMPHAALRAYVMGERAHEDNATDDDVATMARLTEEAIAAGAVGFSTSRTILHSSRHGLIPGTKAMPDELLAIGDALGRAGRGVFQMVTDLMFDEPERSWLVELARRTGRTVTFSMAQAPHDPRGFERKLADAESLAVEGINIVPQVPSRPTGMLFGLQSSLHPFTTHPSYRAIADLPLDERVARLRTPEMRAQLLSETPRTKSAVAVALMSRWQQMFRLGDPPDYEPPAETSVAAIAAKEGREPADVALDWLLERDGKALLFAPLGSYVDSNHDAIRTMMTSPQSALGLSDGGAHCGLICDASMTTYVLTHWVRDRTRGERLPVEHAVHMQTGRTAAVYGFGDRGELKQGKRADINVIDLDALHLHAPEMIFDLPAGGRRLVQRVDGYKHTFCAGQETFTNGVATGARPGRLVRGTA